MKYIVSILAVIVFSSFTICQKMISKHSNKSYELHLYPNCSDTTTFLILEYDIRGIYRDKKIGEKEWTEHKQGVSVSERCYLKGISKYSSDFYTGDDTFYAERTTLSEEKHEYYSVNIRNHPSCRSIQLNDSIEVALNYYADGGVSSCRLTNRKKYKRSDAIEWDSSYTYRWQGNLETVTSAANADTIVYDDYTERNKVVISDSTRKVGVWKKYDNFTGALLDSVDHK